MNIKERFEAGQIDAAVQEIVEKRRAHTVTLVSAETSMCIHLRPIEGHTNEVGSMPALLEELDAADGRTDIFGVVTTDAGNTSLASARKTIELGYHYPLDR